MSGQRDCAPGDAAALWAMVNQASRIKARVQGSDICEAYQAARAAAQEVWRRSPRPAYPASGHSPRISSEHSRAEKAASKAIRDWLDVATA